MTGGALASLLVAALLASGTSGVTALWADAPADPVFTFADPRIRESSGLVDLGALMVTANDSGDTGRVFTVDPATGETVGVTTFDAEAVDVEALAPAGRRAVWVGDIGDNRSNRDEVVVSRVPVGRGEAEVDSPARFRLVYPDGPRDAESLLATRSGRLLVITKSFAGGTVYRAPERLRPDAPNRLEAVGKVPDLATDAAFLERDRFVVVRGLAQASVYTFPALERVGTFALPAQRQGEGVSVGPGGRLRISSEGVGTSVRQVALPPGIARAMRAPDPAAAAPSTQPPVSRTEDGDTASSWLAWSLAGAAVLVAVGVAVGLTRRPA